MPQVQEAAQVAASKLQYRHPNAKMGFIRQRKDGTTSLAILAPCDPGAQSGTKEVPITLGKRHVYVLGSIKYTFFI